MSEPAVKPRSYDNRNRAHQARLTRRRIVAAAQELLLAQGYGATTLASVAGAAGVSVDTVYKAFGSKAGLLKAAYDTALAGDDEPVAMADRPEFRAMVDESDGRRTVELYAAIARQLGERLGPLLEVLLATRGSDPDLDAFATTIDRERLIGAEMFVRHLAETAKLRADVDIQRARDVLWTLNSPEVYLLLVSKRGWTGEAYERWLVAALTDELVAPRP
jgi:AcrR family transcriptional regulator